MTDDALGAVCAALCGAVCSAICYDFTSQSARTALFPLPQLTFLKRTCARRVCVPARGDGAGGKRPGWTGAGSARRSCPGRGSRVRSVLCRSRSRELLTRRPRGRAFSLPPFPFCPTLRLPVQRWRAGERADSAPPSAAIFKLSVRVLATAIYTAQCMDS